MHWQETLVTPPGSEPVTTDEAKLWARVDIPDDDATITSLIVAARRTVETRIRALIVRQTWQYVGDGFPVGGYFGRPFRHAGLGFFGWFPSSNLPLRLPRTPLVSVTSITYLDSAGNPQTLDASLYVVEPGTPGRIVPAYGKIWPTVLNMIGAVKITYIAGMVATGDLAPENVKTAIKTLVNLYYWGREEVGAIPEGVDRMLDADDPGFYG